MSLRTFRLPSHVADLVTARNLLRDHYRTSGLRFTFDGNLVGDLGEALASDIFGINLSGRSRIGVDGNAPDGRTVQIKASGTRRGPVFRSTFEVADHLIFFHLDFDQCLAEIIYNGPEAPVRKELVRGKPESWSGQRMIDVRRMRDLDTLVPDSGRLPVLAVQISA